MFKLFLLSTILALTLSITYPVYKQCDDQWANQLLGFSTNETICSSGSLITSVAMGLKGIGKDYNPSSLNEWLKKNKGYIGTTLYVWASVNPLGLVFQGYVGVSQIRASFDKGRVVLVQIKQTGDWTIMTGHDNYTVFVNDPKKGATSYNLTEITDGNSGIYIAPNTTVPVSQNYWATKLLSKLLNVIYGQEKTEDIQFSVNEEQDMDIQKIIKERNLVFEDK